MEHFTAKFNALAHKISHLADDILGSNAFVWICILIGIALRSLHYFSDPSLWRDEAALAFNIVERNLPELIGPLGGGQMAPAGFLVIVKLLGKMFGYHEYVLRLFPFMCGIGSLFLFKYVAARILEKRAAALALCLFALSLYLVHYSAEFKQYSSDVAATLALYASALPLLKPEFRFSRLILFAIVGTIAIIISHPAAFILLGIGLSLVIYFATQRELRKLIQLSVIYGIWFLCFLYFLIMVFPAMSSVVTGLQDAWEYAFMPFPPTSLSDVGWFGRRFMGLVKYPLGLSFPIVIGLVFAAGCISLYKGKRLYLFLLLSPILVALVISGFRLYPFAQRLMLYAVPAIMVLLAEGLQYIRTRTNRISPAIGLILIGLVFLKPTIVTAYNLLTGPPYRVHHAEEIRPVLNFMKKHAKPGDTIYLYYGSGPAFHYYSAQYGLDDMPVLSSGYYRGNWDEYISNIKGFDSNKRIWFLFSHVWGGRMKGMSEEEYIVNYLDRSGIKVAQFKTRGASVYLYDLHNTTQPNNPTNSSNPSNPINSSNSSNSGNPSNLYPVEFEDYSTGVYPVEFGFSRHIQPGQLTSSNSSNPSNTSNTSNTNNSSNPINPNNPYGP